MSQRITIDPVSLIEGHAKISIFLDDAGAVTDARFHVTEFRGFERFCEGRPFSEMAGLSARICGICPVSHLMASSKAGDAIQAVRIPPRSREAPPADEPRPDHPVARAELLPPRRSRSRHGLGQRPATRNVFGLIEADPTLARSSIRLRQFGQEIIESLGGRKIHPAWTVPGGGREPHSAERRDHLLGRLPEARATALAAFELFKGMPDRFGEEVATFGNFPTLFLSLVRPDGLWEHYDGHLRVVDAEGKVVADLSDPSCYAEIVGESVEHDSHLKSPYFRPLGFDDGVYRVGPLARLNVCTSMGTPSAPRSTSTTPGSSRSWPRRSMSSVCSPTPTWSRTGCARTAGSIVSKASA